MTNYSLKTTAQGRGFLRRSHGSLLLRFAVALSILTLISSSACHRDADQSLTRAVEAWDSGDYKTAAEEYERYLYQRPTGDKALDARFQLANIYYFKLQRYDQARANYTAFIEQNPNSANSQLARERLAEVLAEMGRSYEAIAEYENLNPQETAERRRIRLRIADLYFAQRNYSQALTEYEKVIEKAPYDELSEQAYLREASVYHIARGQYQQALPIYEKLASMTADPKVRLRAAYARADCYAGLYQFDEAIKTLRSIKDDSEQTDVSRRVAELDLRRQEAVRARTGLEATGTKQERGKPDAKAAIKAEAPTAIAAEKPTAAKPDKNKKPEKADTAQPTNSNKRSKTRKTENAQPENANAGRRSRSRKTDNAQPANSNTPKKNRSRKTENAAPANSNTPKKSRSRKTDNAQPANSNTPKKSRSRKTDNAQPASSNAVKNAKPKATGNTRARNTNTPKKAKKTANSN